MAVLSGWIASAAGVQRGRLTLGARIERIELDGTPVPAPTDDASIILPGFVDVHVHGGAGGDTMDGPDGVRTMARHHLTHGTTTLLPTTLTQPWADVLAALDGVIEVRREAAAGADRDSGGLPEIPGAHLEGPFVSPDRLGAQPPFAIPPDADRVAEVLARDVVRIVTMAPELEGAEAAARTFAAAGVRVSLGHTTAGAATVARIAHAGRGDGGTLGFTHLYNAMGGLAGRAPGVVGACLADPDAYAELILDGHHVDPVAFLAAYAAKGDRLLLITDAIRACGLPDGETVVAEQPVTVTDGAARLADGTLAGSVLTLDAALRNAVAAGIPLVRASHLASGAPAGYLGLNDRGRIEPGLRADVVELSSDLHVQRVFVAGREAAGPLEG